MAVRPIVEGIYNVCRIMSYGVSSIAELLSCVVYANYEIMSVVFHHLLLIASTIIWMVEGVVYGAVNLLQHILDFSSDILGCFFTFFTLLWKILLLIYKIVCLILTGMETVAICLWTGSYVTLTTLKQSATDVIETCGSTWNYGVDLTRNFADTIVGGLSMIGTLGVSLVKGIFNGLGYGFASLLRCIWNLGDNLMQAWNSFTSNITEMFTFSKEAYLGLLLCLLSYMLLSKILGTFRQRGVSFWSWWKRLTRGPRYHRRRNVYGIDNDFESDFEEQDYESDDMTSDGNETLTEASDEDGNTDDDSSDGDEEDDDDDDESEGSLNSQTFSSDESDHDIEIHLPTPAERYNLRSRSSTPSRVKKDSMTTYDYEAEIEREKDKRKCVVCQDQTKSVLILPCRHMCLCVDCANQIVRARMLERRVCPLCRQRIEKVMDVYV